MKNQIKSYQLKAGEFCYPDAAGKFEDLGSANVKARSEDVARSTRGTLGTFAFSSREGE